ncbi:hypothetical protein C5167_044204 [Papaver somniferum]|uniref:DUF4283 domain-containing protein n=1 Tax=Papaver somniferum TaxID=3469 RepID=A0A4Y7LBF8_PAPSO|nr:hypothetical protein C5167_044204 [Papaver somniferum]
MKDLLQEFRTWDTFEDMEKGFCGYLSQLPELPQKTEVRDQEKLIKDMKHPYVVDLPCFEELFSYKQKSSFELYREVVAENKRRMMFYKVDEQRVRDLQAKLQEAEDKCTPLFRQLKQLGAVRGCVKCSIRSLELDLDSRSKPSFGYAEQIEFMRKTLVGDKERCVGAIARLRPCQVSCSFQRKEGKLQFNSSFPHGGDIPSNASKKQFFLLKDNRVKRYYENNEKISIITTYLFSKKSIAYKNCEDLVIHCAHVRKSISCNIVINGRFIQVAIYLRLPKALFTCKDCVYNNPLEDQACYNTLNNYIAHLISFLEDQYNPLTKKDDPEGLIVGEMEFALNQAWSPIGRLIIKKTSNPKVFIIRFTNASDFAAAVYSIPNRVRGKLLTMRLWTIESKIEEIDFNDQDRWINST